VRYLLGANFGKTSVTATVGARGRLKIAAGWVVKSVAYILAGVGRVSWLSAAVVGEEAQVRDIALISVGTIVEGVWACVRSVVTAEKSRAGNGRGGEKRSGDERFGKHGAGSWD